MSNCSNPDYVTSAEVNAIKATLADPLSLDAFWLVVNAEIVFLMQLGFMLLEVGSVRAQHAKAICVKNVVDFLIVRPPPSSLLYIQHCQSSFFLVTVPTTCSHSALHTCIHLPEIDILFTVRLVRGMQTEILTLAMSFCR